MSKQINAAKSIINENNLLREQLSNENKKYYEQLLIYIRTAGLFYDDYEIESTLFQILQDILLAQDDGQSAEEYFGKNPQDAADELIQNLGKSSTKESLKIAGLIFGISSFFSLISALTNPGEGINLLVLILNGLLSFLFVGIVFFVVHKSIYKKIASNKIISFLLLWLCCCLVIGAFILVSLLTPSIFTVHISKPIGIFIISILLIGVTYLAFIHNKENRDDWLPFLPFIWILGGIGIASRLSWTENWLASKNGQTTTLWLTILGFILFLGLSLLLMRKKK